MGVTVGFTLKWLSREANVAPGPLPEDMRRSIIDHLDQGTERAILRLYRSSPPERTGRRRRAPRRCLGAPTLVVWGTRDPDIPARFGRDYAAAFPDAELLELPDAGHWPGSTAPTCRRACTSSWPADEHRRRRMTGTALGEPRALGGHGSGRSSSAPARSGRAAGWLAHAPAWVR